MKNFYLFQSKDEYLIKKKIDDLLESNNLSDEILDLYDMEEGSGFVFEISFALDNGKTPGVNVVLLYYEDNEYKSGYRCRDSGR